MGEFAEKVVVVSAAAVVVLLVVSLFTLAIIETIDKKIEVS